MDWPASIAICIASICATVAYLAPQYWPPQEYERTEAIGFHVGQGPDHDED
jgi:hypothetical protein